MIINSDCIEAMRKMGNCSIDLIVTSPPYDEIRDYNGYTMNIHGVCYESYRLLKDGGMLCMVINDSTKEYGKSCTTYRVILDCVDNIGFKLFENVIYAKDGRPGAWWNKRFRVDHEYILMFLKGKKPKYFDKEHLKVPAIHAGKMARGTQRLTNGNMVLIKDNIVKDKKCRGTIWKYVTSKSDGDKIKLKHPATFPDKLAEDLILCFSDEGDVILDPFCGSGTTIVMAKRNNRKYIGIEISKEYCEISQERLDSIQ